MTYDNVVKITLSRSPVLGTLRRPSLSEHVTERKRRATMVAGTALVFVDRRASHLDADSVVSDNRGGATLAARHLLERGHRRIGFLGDLLSISTAEERLRGYMQALESAVVGIDDDLIRADLRDPDAAVRA